jgi:RsiW-degrading membrane proteinase PrsW (M82 family)
MKRLVLTVEGGALAGRDFILEHGALALGRDEASDVRFGTSEPQVSRRHAVIQLEDAGFRLVDQSTNGTQVNEQRVQDAVLASGDVIELGSGGPRLRVRIDAEERGQARAMLAPAPAPSLADHTLYNPEKDKGKRYSMLSILLVLGMMGVGAFLGLLVLLMTSFELGPAASLIGVTVAFAPAPLYLLLWLWLDRYDPEPAWVLAGCLAWGAGAATFVSGIFNTIFGVAMASLTGNRGLAEFLSAAISAPFVEEATKGLAVLAIFLVLRREFDGILDGIVYAGVVALGFATVENVLYYGRSAAKGGPSAVIVVFLLRGILGPFGHSVFTSMTGLGCGIARQTHNAVLRVIAPPLGYAGAVLLHFLWNTLAGLTGSLGGFLAVYLLIWMPLFFTFLAFVLWMGFRESRLIRRMLEPEVALGLLTREQADIAGSWPRRVRWLFSTAGNLQRLGARRKFLHAATRLALCYWHVERASSAGGMTMSVGQVPVFRNELARLKATV